MYELSLVHFRLHQSLMMHLILQVHSNKMESENNLYKQQLMERQAHHDNHRHSQYGSSEMLKEMYDSQVDL